METDYDDTYLNGMYSDGILQGDDDTCAIKSQQLILQSYGFDVTEGQLCEEALQNGWYTHGIGTPMECVGNLLESHGIDVHKCQGATLDDLKDEIYNGRQVIVGVDSGELWNPGPDETFEDILYGGQADHALLVSGFTVNPYTAEECVLLTDPGTGELYAEYPSGQFEDAWDDSGDFMVSALIEKF